MSANADTPSINAVAAAGLTTLSESIDHAHVPVEPPSDVAANLEDRQAVPAAAAPQRPLRKRKAGASHSSLESRLLDQLKRRCLSASWAIGGHMVFRRGQLHLNNFAARPAIKAPPLAQQFNCRTVALIMQTWKHSSAYQVAMNEYYRDELGLGDPRTDIMVSLIAWPALDDYPTTDAGRLMPWHVIPLWKDEAPRYHAVPIAARPSMIQEPARSIIHTKLIALKAQLLSDPSFMAAWFYPTETVKLAMEAPDDQGTNNQQRKTEARARAAAMTSDS